jgi:hypothetical protein
MTTYVPAFNRRINKNVKTYAYLNASEGFITLTPENTTNLSQLIEKVTVDHRD